MVVTSANGGKGGSADITVRDRAGLVTVGAEATLLLDFTCMLEKSQVIVDSN